MSVAQGLTLALAGSILPARYRTLSYDPSNIFARILRGELATEFLHQDDLCVAFRDVAPQAPTHILVIPRQPISSLAAAAPTDAKLLGHLLLVAAGLAQRLGLADAGYRTVINTGAGGGQSVFHLHVHLLAGRAFAWPPG